MCDMVRNKEEGRRVGLFENDIGGEEKLRSGIA